MVYAKIVSALRVSFNDTPAKGQRIVFDGFVCCGLLFNPAYAAINLLCVGLMLVGL